MISIVQSTFAFLIMISAIVFIHEWGHYRSARVFGLVAQTFSIGFGPRIGSYVDRRGTRWTVSAILLGGYVSFPGDDPNKPVETDQKTLNGLSRWRRAIVVGAGPGINFLLAATIFSAIAGFWGYPDGRPLVTRVVHGSGAERAGLKPGDLITAIDATRIETASDVGQEVIMHPGRTVRVSYRRNNVPAAVRVRISRSVYRDEDGNPAEIGILGVEMPNVRRRASNPIEAIHKGISDGIFMTRTQLQSIAQMVSGERSVMEMSGPVRIARMSAHTMSQGLVPFLYLMAIISIAVGTMNLLPIPGLDGGHLAKYAIEGALRRDLPEKLVRNATAVGFSLIVGMGIFAITVDILALT